METFTQVCGVAAPMMQINIDTDQIIPARYLGGTDAKGYGAHLFANARFLADGQPNPDFVLNQVPFDQAQRLQVGRQRQTVFVGLTVADVLAHEAVRGTVSVAGKTLLHQIHQ